MRAEHELLGDGVHLLILMKLQIVGCHIVLVHQHHILQILIAGSRGEEQFLHVVADIQAGVEHITLITVHDGGGRILHIIIINIQLTIGKTILIHILVISCPVEGQLPVGLIDQAQLTTCLIALVVLL